MMDAYYKEYGLSPIVARDEILKMVDWETKKGWGYSVEMKKLVQLYKYYAGTSGKIIEYPTVEQIKNSIANGHPLLAVANGKILPNPYFSNGGPEYHVLIIKCYTEDSFITNDPGTKRGENFLYKYVDLMNAIADWNDGDVKNGRSVILVQE